MRWILSVLMVWVAAAPLAHADRLINIPTGETLSLGAFRVAAARRFGDFTRLNAEVGLPLRFEVNLEHVDRDDDGSDTGVGGQFRLLSENVALPALSVGVVDIADDTPRGRGIFLVASKRLPFTERLPGPGRDFRVHLGVGADRFSGVFAGAEVGLLPRIRGVAEFDSEDFNFGIWWDAAPMLRVRTELHDGDFVLGAQLRVSR